jgi:hypothetical protein
MSKSFQVSHVRDEWRCSAHTEKSIEFHESHMLLEMKYLNIE